MSLTPGDLVLRIIGRFNGRTRLSVLVRGDPEVRCCPSSLGSRSPPVEARFSRSRPETSPLECSGEGLKHCAGLHDASSQGGPTPAPVATKWRCGGLLRA